jgi:hypothetical protein
MPAPIFWPVIAFMLAGGLWMVAAADYTSSSLIVPLCFLSLPLIFLGDRLFTHRKFTDKSLRGTDKR